MTEIKKEREVNARQRNSSSSPSKRSYQPSLLEFGKGTATARPKRTAASQGTEGADDAERGTKKARVDGASGTTTKDDELLPVTRQAFIDEYRVDGLDSVYYQRDWVDAKTAHRWHKELDALQEWYRPKLKVYGREIQQSRSIAAFSTAPGLELKYSGHQVSMHSPFPPLLESIAAQLSSDDCLGSEVKFNHAMLNSYADGSVYIGRHSDNMENKVIVTVSLGAPRKWIMEEKKSRGSTEKGSKHQWVLENGSILVMQGDVQKRYTHEIPKEPKVKESRIVRAHERKVDKPDLTYPRPFRPQSITFRQLVY